MSSGFISGGTTDAPIERDSEWIVAQQEIEATRRRKEEESRQTGGKTLYDTLQANKGERPYVSSHQPRRHKTSGPEGLTYQELCATRSGQARSV